MLRVLMQMHSIANCRFSSAVLVATANAQTKASESIDFQRDIRPILHRNCASCHSGPEPAGGLRVGSYDEAADGGDTRLPVLGGTRKTNEVFLRVSSDQMAYRMPKGAPALSPEQIDKFARWVDAGTPWSEPLSGASSSAETEDLTWLEQAVNWGADLNSQLHRRICG